MTSTRVAGAGDGLLALHGGGGEPLAAGGLGPACARADVDGQHGRHERDEQRGDNDVPRNPPMDHERNDPDATASPQANGKTCPASVDPGESRD